MRKHRVNSHLVPDRGFVVTVSFVDGTSRTLVIYAANAQDAEQRAMMTHGAASAIVRNVLGVR